MQFRYLGGAVGLGITTAVFNNSVRSGLASLLAPTDVFRVLESTELIHELPNPLQQEVQHVFGNSFTLQWKTLLGFVCAQVPAALMML